MKCFLDVDGVLSAFNKRAFEALGLNFNPNHPALSDWNWYRYFGLSFDDLDSVCNEDFWAGLLWMPDGRAILEAVEETFSEIYLVTTPMPNVGSATGKMKWIRRHLPKYEKKTIITTAGKDLLAGRDRLLIDDNDENVLGFVQAGGEAILVPRTYNAMRDWAEHSSEIVNKRLGGYQ